MLGCRQIVTLWLAPLLGFVTWGQTTYGIVSGRVSDNSTGRPLAGAIVRCERSDGDSYFTASLSDSAGFFVLKTLPAGSYRLRPLLNNYREEPWTEIEVPVAGRVEVDFRMKSIGSDQAARSIYRGLVLDSGEIVNYFGVDAGLGTAEIRPAVPKYDTLEASLSYAIKPELVNELPIFGRDVYGLLETVPGVTADILTARGLGLSVSGQRPTSSNFLLDGVENIDPVTSGPMIVPQPEVVEAYRVSTNNFSAEFGRTSGVVANTVTRAGTNQYHGLAFANYNNDILNANSLRLNALGISRRPRKDGYYGAWLGGPVPKTPLLFSSSVEYFRSRTRDDPVPYLFPSSAFVSTLNPGSEAAMLMSKYPVPAGATAIGSTVTQVIAKPIAEDRKGILERLDYQHGSSRYTSRLAFSSDDLPDFIYSPYPDFTSGAETSATNLSFRYIRQIASYTNELRAAWTHSNLQWNRAHPEIPTLSTFSGVTLPGSPAAYDYRDRGNTVELGDTVVTTKGSHVITGGATVFLRRTDLLQSLFRDASYTFQDLNSFASGTNVNGTFSLSRARPPGANPNDNPGSLVPDYEHRYANTEAFGFIQDNFKLGSRFGLSAGIRYEYFGAPRIVNGTEGFISLAQGSDIEQRLAGAQISYQSTGEPSVYWPDPNNWAPRLGFTANLSRDGNRLIRLAYGIFYDRPFENLSRDTRNNLAIVSTYFSGSVNYLQPAPNVVQNFAPPFLASLGLGSFPELLWVDKGLRTPYSQNYFAGLEQKFKNWSLEASWIGTSGRRLIATDLVNRIFSLPASFFNSLGRINPLLPDILYRSNFGSSTYQALGTTARYSSKRGDLFTISYTFGKSLDNQSDPLEGQAFSVTSGDTDRNTFAALTRQFDSRVDRGPSDFDQRQNLVFYSYFNSPRIHGRFSWLVRDWRFSQLAAVRSGFPYTVIVPGETSSLIHNRPDLNRSNPAYQNPVAVVGSGGAPGVQLLDPSAFSTPATGVLGSLGRNSLAGPGFWIVNASLARTLLLHEGRSRSVRLQVRADLFNLFNHTNLSNPVSTLGAPDFGVAYWGRAPRQASSSLTNGGTPLTESPRLVQLQLKLLF